MTVDHKTHIENYQKQIETVKQDSDYTEEEKKNICAYYELQIRLEQYQQEKAERQQARAKARRLAKQILKRRDEILKLRKELSAIFYDNSSHAAFGYSDRRFDPKNSAINDALGVVVE